MVGGAAAVTGTIAALYYARIGLTLTHYDARGHLIVARRVLDSITPGWQQIGAVWLPLPHLLNLLPVQVDAWYRSGASGVAISVLAFALAVSMVAWIVLQVTDSMAASGVASAAFALNPNLLYLQSTPMTEPLLLGLTLLAVALLMSWCSTGSDRTGPPTAREVLASPTPAVQEQRSQRAHRRRNSLRFGPATIGIAFALACLTRYEAWPVTAAALSAAVWARWRNGAALARAVLGVAAIAIYPALALIVFAVSSRVVGGQWFTVSGFFVPENKALGRPVLALAEIAWGSHALTGTLTMAVAAIGVCAVLVTAVRDRQRAHLLIVLALLASAALPWAAFVRGHPFRIRYMVPLIAAEAIGIGAATALVRGAAPIVAIVVALALAIELRPLSSLAPMVLEAQWDRPNIRARQRVTDCLRASDDGETIMASMGSLGHYMQEMSRDGILLRRFLHEGNGDIWLWALNGPRRYAGWLLIEEKAEGGDMLAQIVREQPAFLDGYARICEGAGVALYRRTSRPAHDAHSPDEADSGGIQR